MRERKLEEAMDWGMHLEEDDEEDMRKQWLREDENGTKGTVRTKQPEIRAFLIKMSEQHQVAQEMVCVRDDQQHSPGEEELVPVDHHPVLGEVAGVLGGPEEDYGRGYVKDDELLTAKEIGSGLADQQPGQDDDDEVERVQGGPEHDDQQLDHEEVEHVQESAGDDDEEVHHDSHQCEVDVDVDDDHNAWEAGHIQHHLCNTNNHSNPILFKDDEPGVERAGGPHGVEANDHGVWGTARLGGEGGATTGVNGGGLFRQDIDTDKVGVCRCVKYKHTNKCANRRKIHIQCYMKMCKIGCECLLHEIDKDSVTNVGKALPDDHQPDGQPHEPGGHGGGRGAGHLGYDDDFHARDGWAGGHGGGLDRDQGDEGGGELQAQGEEHVGDRPENQHGGQQGRPQQEQGVAEQQDRSRSLIKTFISKQGGGEQVDGGGRWVGDEEGRGGPRRKAIGRRRLSVREGGVQKCLIQPKIVLFLRGFLGGSVTNDKNVNDQYAMGRPKRRMTSQSDEMKGKKLRKK